MRIFIYLFLLVIVTSCSYHIDEVEECSVSTKDDISYSIDAYPILSKNCALSGCHTTGFEYGNFTRYEDLKAKAENGILEFMIQTNEMPHGASDGPKYLNNCEMMILNNWIRQGAQNN